MTILHLEAARRQRGGDDARFLVCPNCGGEDFSVVCRFASGQPFVASLLCIKCDPPFEIGVVNGLLT